MTDASPSCLVLLSGGIDSAVCAYLAKEKYSSVHCLHFQYGQRNAKKERACASLIANGIKATTYYEIDMPWYSLINQNSAVLNPEMPIDKEVTKGELPNTIVPFRNGTMISIATAFADAWDIDAIYIGAISDDEDPYPDCRPEFFWAMQNVLFNGSSKAHPILEVPLQGMDKEEVIALGKKMKVPFINTWSCLANNKGCNQCIACNARKQAFRANQLEDPIHAE